MKSLREHPKCLSSGQECKQLKGFGDKICKKIDDRLALINGQTVDKDIQTTQTTDRQITDLLPQRKKRPLKPTPNKEGVSPLPKVSKTNANRKTGNYVPIEGSGAYAILMALIKAEIEDNSDSLGKQELQNLAQEFTTTSMTVGVNGSHYSGWSAIKTLINKGLIERNNQRFSSYFLTQTGRDLAQKLYQIYTEKQTNLRSNEQNNNFTSIRERNVESSDSESIFPEIITQTNCHTFREESPSECSSTNQFSDQFSLAANTYEIVLCIDSREQASGVNREMRKTALMSVLQQNGVKVEMRTLSVGDFAWTAKQKINFGTNIATINSLNYSRKELILDYVIERKRIDDLASSLKDRRWDEQKYRLNNCGVRKPSYIIEYFGSNNKSRDFGGIKCDTLEQAIINAQVDGFSIKRCDSYDDTIRYLTLMTRYMESHFKDKTIYSCSKEQLINEEVARDRFMTFSEFSRNSNKITNFTVKEMFLKHLLQMKGISVNKAKVIVSYYPSLQYLLDAYNIADSLKEKQNLLSSLKSGLMEKKFGPNLSKKVYNHYN